jgi:hypothetical protein
MTKTSSLKSKISSISSNDQWEINSLTGMSRAEEGRAYKAYGERLAAAAAAAAAEALIIKNDKNKIK